MKTFGSFEIYRALEKYHYDALKHILQHCEDNEYRFDSGQPIMTLEDDWNDHPYHAVVESIYIDSKTGELWMECRYKETEEPFTEMIGFLGGEQMEILLSRIPDLVLDSIPDFPFPDLNNVSSI